MMEFKKKKNKKNNKRWISNLNLIISKVIIMTNYQKNKH